MTIRNKKRLYSGLTVTAALLLTSLLFAAIFLYDNKYNSTAPRGQDGKITITLDALSENPLIPLIDGWRLDVGGEEREVFIGQYGNFSFYDGGKSPYGEGVYSLTVDNKTGAPLAMELPEVFSAYKVYINGSLAAQNGEPSRSGYRARIQNKLVPLPNGYSKLAIHTANYTHYYSGVTYPPMLGTAQAVGDMIFKRFTFYGLLVFFSASMGLFTLVLWGYHRGNKLYLYFGALCMFFVFSVSYPFWHWSGGGAVRLSYAVEDFSAFAILLCVTGICGIVCGVQKSSIAHRLALSLCAALCLASLIFPAFVLPLAPAAVNPYGYALNAIKLAICAYLILRAFLACALAHGTPPRLLLAGVSVYGFGVLTDVFTSNRFEPIYFGWQTEYCGFLMVLAFGGMMISLTMTMLRENELLTNSLEEQVELHTAQLTALLQERKRFVASLSHDLKAPAAAIQTYVEFIRQGGVQVDDELSRYLSVIDKKSDEMQRRVKVLQAFNTDEFTTEEKTIVRVSAFLGEVYEANLPAANAAGIRLSLKALRGEASINAHPQRLLRAFENIIGNAIAFTPKGGCIKIAAHTADGKAVIIVSDSGRGIEPQNLPRIFDCKFSVRAEGEGGGGQGLGLYFTRSAIHELGGDITAQSAVNKGTEITVTLPLC